MKIISWNVNGIRAIVGKGFYDVIKEMDPDILCIQEIKAQEDTMPVLPAEMNEYTMVFNSAVKKGYSGTAVYTRIKPMKQKMGINHEDHDQEGRVITLEYPGFYLVNVYVPNSGQDLKRLDYRKEWDHEFMVYIQKLDAVKPVILTGDLNVAHEPVDLARPKENYNKSAGFTQVEIDGLENLLKTGLVDTYRKLYPDRVQYTFWNQRFRAREKNVGWRIDYFLVSERLFSSIKDSFIWDQIMGSDHCPVGIEIEDRR
ncbi:MAG: exodeoxyribonuclease III [Bacteroidales bacterium]|nr:exodeoxyribonuclease III [Bacteroidales bacterium]MBN2761938.1 exodeoxyribonuclease III [Bacteroidales bacterium]